MWLSKQIRRVVIPLLIAMTLFFPTVAKAQAQENTTSSLPSYRSLFNRNIYWYDPCVRSTGDVDQSEQPGSGGGGGPADVALQGVSKQPHFKDEIGLDGQVHELLDSVGGVVIHYTAATYGSNDPGGIIAGLDAQANAPGLNAPSGLSVQFYVSQEGQAFQLTDHVNSFARHAGSRDDVVNRNTIGIEIEGANEQNLLDNGAQNQAVLNLVKQLVQHFNIPTTGDSSAVRGLYGHDEIGANDNFDTTSRGKSDPGPSYMAKLRTDLGPGGSGQGAPPSASPTGAGCEEETTSSQCYEVKLPPITDESKLAAAINKYMEEHSQPQAPLRGLGDKFVSGAKRAGINPLLEVGIAQHESSFGVAGIATQGTNNAFGRTATAQQPNVSVRGRLWYRYDSWAASLDGGGADDQPTYIKSVYLNQGINTLEPFIHKYAPSSDGNNETAYVQALKDTINTISQYPDSGIACGGVSDGSAAGNKQLGQKMAAERGWIGAEWECLLQLWEHESGWNQTAHNPSTAYGIPQALLSVHKDNIQTNYLGFFAGDYRNPSGGDPEIQIRWGLDYIGGKYKTPCGAWNHFQGAGSY